jgi:hypothetical protein
MIEACVTNALAFEYEDVLARKLSARRQQFSKDDMIQAQLVREKCWSLLKMIFCN